MKMVGDKLLKDTHALHELTVDTDQLSSQSQTCLWHDATLREACEQEPQRLQIKPLGVQLLMNARYIPNSVISQLWILANDLTKGLQRLWIPLQTQGRMSV